MGYKYVYPVLVRRGLCNLLFTWAQAEAYCHSTGAKMIAPRWVSICRIGPWLRREKYKRYYGGQFTTAGQTTGIKKWFLLIFARRRVKMFHGMENFFDPFIADQPHIKNSLWCMTYPEIRAEVERLATEPFIAVHIRRGDFKQAGWLVGDEWYVEATRRAIKDLKVPGVPLIRVFTDGYEREVAFLAKALPDARVEIMGKAAPMRDLLLMSRAKFLVGSSASTFSMWAVFLGQMPSYWASADCPRLYTRDSLGTVVNENN